MCGRYVLDKDIDVVEKRFNAGVKGHHEWHPRYNIAPAQELPVVTKPGELMFLRWGFAPEWSDKEVINARHETVHDKPYFRDAVHCLVPATGYYEWKREGDHKVPYYFHIQDEELVALAGVYGETGFAILTVPSDDIAGAVHHRMPLILDRTHEELWLAGDDVPEHSPGALQTHEVSTAVNSPQHDEPSLIVSPD